MHEQEEMDRMRLLLDGMQKRQSKMAHEIHSHQTNTRTITQSQQAQVNSILCKFK
ncbi:hypothetical protein DFR42_107276 [Undibacterium pigrum]|uniref:Uncharacterized protein n=1 Tax=Undibacterium pigrum TaxID=401470 RepID=A0A318J2K3_9BURK|nr:hypothetical protein DFR42_107276 [Undibacterium pigrum]